MNPNPNPNPPPLQRCCIENIFRACVALPPTNHMALEHKRGVAETAVHAAAHAAKKQKKK